MTRSQRILLTLAAVLISLNCLQYDSQFAKNFIMPNPGIAFSIAIPTLLALIGVASRSLLHMGREISVVVFLLFLYALVSILSAALSQTGTVFSLGAKSLTIFFIGAFLHFGFVLSRLEADKYLAKFTMLISLLMSVPAAFLPDSGFNMNWVTINILLSFTFLVVATGKPSGGFGFFISIALGFGMFIFFQARGTSIAFFLTAIVFLTLDVIRFRHVSFLLSRLMILTAPIAGIIGTSIGIWIFNSPFYKYLFYLSWDLTGKSLDSSRLVRWDASFWAFLDRPVLGWGIDSHIARVTNDYTLGDIHNFWLEYLFRGGLVGGSIILLVIYFVFHRINAIRRNISALVFAAVFLVVNSVYALGGLTHWPGTFFLWMIIGSLLQKAENVKEGSSHEVV